LKRQAPFGHANGKNPGQADRYNDNRTDG
jgi:hypothetical protein